MDIIGNVEDKNEEEAGEAEPQSDHDEVRSQDTSIEFSNIWITALDNIESTKPKLTLYRDIFSCGLG